MPSFFPEDNAPMPGDSEQRSLSKIVSLLGGGGGGGGLYARRLYGVGSPEGVVVAWPGEIYVDTATGEQWSKTSGDGTNTGWQ